MTFRECPIADFSYCHKKAPHCGARISQRVSGESLLCNISSMAADPRTAQITILQHS
jgi:hypothetical protein